MNRQIRFALSATLAATTVLIGIAWLASCVSLPEEEPLPPPAGVEHPSSSPPSGAEPVPSPAAQPASSPPLPVEIVDQLYIPMSAPRAVLRPPSGADSQSAAASEEIWVIAKPTSGHGLLAEADVVEIPVSATYRDTKLADTPGTIGSPEMANRTALSGFGNKVARVRSKAEEDAAQPEPGSGSMVANIGSEADDGSTHRVPLPLQHTAVDAAIAGHIGTVNVKQQFANPFDTKIEAVYLFPLPERAAVTEFLMVIGERTIRGILREKEEAEAIYREARAQGYRASLLVQRRPNIFEQKVANIEPGNVIDVDITYFHTLAYKDGWYSFVFPTVVGPRFNPPGRADPIPPMPRGGNSRAAGATGVEYLKPTERSGHDLAITVQVDAGVTIEELKSTHQIEIERDGAASATVQLAQRKTVPNRDFVLDFRVASEDVKSNLMTHRNPETGEGFFSLMVIPPIDTEVVARRPMEMVFVIDCSGSMSGWPLQQAKEAIRTALGRLNPDDTFQIIRFSDDASQFGAAPVPATEANLAAARRYLQHLDGEGGTWMIEGIKAALDFPHNPSRFRFVSFMTDGYIGNEGEILAEVHRRLGASRIFSFGVGTSVNRYLLERMAKEGRGVAAYLGLHDSAEEVMGAFFDRVSHAALTDIEIEWGSMTVSETFPTRVPDLFVGRPLVVSGRFEGEPGSVTISGTVDDSRRSLVIDGTSQGAGPSIAKVWARSNIAELSDRQATVGDPHGRLGETILRVALQHQLVSNYTSFVAVDSSAPTAGQYGVTVHQAVPVPDGVRYDTTVE